MRIGHGYDVHKLADNRRLIIGGVVIPHAKGLLGHSDADVLTHAVIDALLGAAALGDIGKHFPPSDNTYLNADSIELLQKIISLLEEKNYTVQNIDCTVIAQLPKLAPYIEEMRNRLAFAIGIPAENVSIKATTEEGLGFSGRQEGIAAHCICLIQ